MRQIKEISATGQLTMRAALAGMILGGLMSLSNLYVVLKTGSTFGVGITSGVVAFAVFGLLHRGGLIRSQLRILENNAMQSVAGAAGSMAGAGNFASIGAMMIISGETLPGWKMILWFSAIAMLGVVMVIPLRRQLIEIEKLPFPSATAAAEALKALYHDSEEAENNLAGPVQKASRSASKLSIGAVSGALVACLRDAHAKWIPWNLPAKICFPAILTLQERPLADFTIWFDPSLMQMAAGALIGMRVAWSILLGAAINYLILVPTMYSEGAIDSKLGFKSIIQWSVWPGAALILMGSLVSFCLQWKNAANEDARIKRSSQTAKFENGKDVPHYYFMVGLAIMAPLVTVLGWAFFQISPFFGAITIFLSFLTMIVATRAAGETDWVPVGALQKLTQICFGLLAPGNLTTNLMTANVAGGVSSHSSDLLSDFKTSHLLRADPIQQFWAQLLGIVAGAAFVVPVYKLLIPTASVLGTDKWPAPSAQMIKGTAILLTQGIHALHPTARVALVLGGLVGTALAILDRRMLMNGPRYRHLIPSAVGMGMGMTMPASNSISIFLGALLAWVITRTNSKVADETIVPISAGVIAGESLIAVLLALLIVLGWLSAG